MDDYYSLPVLRDLLMCLGRRNKVFSNSDPVSGYWQVLMAKASREVTAFSTPTGHFEWTRMALTFHSKKKKKKKKKIYRQLYGKIDSHNSVEA